MPPPLKKFLKSWIINTLAVLLAVAIVPGINYDQLTDLLKASLLLGVLNAFLRPVLLVVALPLLIYTLGLFMLVINGLLLYFVGVLLQPHFSVRNFWAAFWGALVISVSSLLLNLLTGAGNARVRFGRHRGPPPSDSGGDGPVIDV